MLHFLLIVLIILQVLDAHSTYLRLRDPNGNSKEGNPVAKYFIDKLGLVPGLLVLKTIIVSALIYCIAVVPANGSIVIILPVVLIYIGVVISNYAR